MNAKEQKWIPIALCCLPGVAVMGVLGIGLTLGGAAFGAWLGGPLGFGLVALAVLACPVSMALMMRRMSRQNVTDEMAHTPGSAMADCCLPAQSQASVADSSVKRLAELKTKREALEREVVEMEAQK